MSLEANSPSYLRRLGTWDAAAIVIGGVIGAGIFRNPATVAERTSAGWQVLLLWAVGGLLTLAGVLCYAELGARRPQAGPRLHQHLPFDSSPVLSLKPVLLIVSFLHLSGTCMPCGSRVSTKVWSPLPVCTDAL